jgi:DNA-nicking Smr family endonuclease
MEIDLHGYHPRQIVWNGLLATIVQQTWEMGETYLRLIHGHGRHRGRSPGFVKPLRDRSLASGRPDHFHAQALAATKLQRGLAFQI